MIGQPNIDRPRGLHGGADAWDEGPAGVILTADYFQEPASGAVAGSLAATEAGKDQAAATGKLIVKGQIAASETGLDTLSASGTLAVAGITGTLSLSEGGKDSAALPGRVLVKGVLGTGETGTDGISSTGKIIIKGGLALSELPDSLHAAGRIIVTGLVIGYEAENDAFASAGFIRISGACAAEEGETDVFLALPPPIIRPAARQHAQTENTARPTAMQSTSRSAHSTLATQRTTTASGQRPASVSRGSRSCR